MAQWKPNKQPSLLTSLWTFGDGKFMNWVPVSSLLPSRLLTNPKTNRNGMHFLIELNNNNKYCLIWQIIMCKSWVRNLAPRRANVTFTRQKFLLNWKKLFYYFFHINMKHVSVNTLNHLQSVKQTKYMIQNIITHW